MVANSSAQLSACENFFLKNTNKREAIDIQHFPLAIYIHSATKISNLRHKTSSAPKIFAALL